MKRNTVIFIVGLGVIAALIGYGKYRLLPKYFAAQPTVTDSNVAPATTSLASPSPLPDSALMSTFEALSPSQKVAQLLAVSVQQNEVEPASTSAKLKWLSQQQPGFVLLLSDQAAADRLELKLNSAALSASKSGQLVESLVVIDTPLNPIVQFSLEPLSAASATSAATLNHQADQALVMGDTVVVVSHQIKTVQLNDLLIHWQELYAESDQFKQLVDRKVLAVLDYKQQWRSNTEKTNE